MEMKKIEIDNQVIEYQLNRKNIKKCYLKIKSGKVIVNAGFDFSVEMIENLILEHKDIILKKVNEYIPKANYIIGGYVYIFNHRYEIIEKKTKDNIVEIVNDKIYVCNTKIKNLIDIKLQEILYDYLREKIDFYLEKMFDLTLPQIEIKKLRSRWGACFLKKNKLSFNLYLVHLDKSLIDYVIIHELCHFIQPNHSKEFYGEVEKRLPDYKRKIKELREIEI